MVHLVVVCKPHDLLTDNYDNNYNNENKTILITKNKKKNNNNHKNLTETYSIHIFCILYSDILSIKPTLSAI